MKMRRGFALAVALALMTLLAILAMATLAVSTRLQQGVTLAERDVLLGGIASAAVVAPIRDWRTKAYSSMAIGETRLQDPAAIASMPNRATVTRLGAELFWIVGEANAVDGARRRENLIVRLTLPSAASVAGLAFTGDATLSRSFQAAADTATGCGTAADLTMRPTASLTAPDGPLPPLRILRDAVAADSAHTIGLDAQTIAGLVATADRTVAPAGSITIGSGITHAAGDLTILGGAGSGILMVDGALTVAGPVTFNGLVIVRELRITTAGSVLRGGVRVVPGYGQPGSVDAQVPVGLIPSACAVQSALIESVRPRPVAGRRWAEMY